MKPIALFSLISLLFFFSCGQGKKSESEVVMEQEESVESADTIARGAVAYVSISDPLDETMVAEGRNIYQTKCFECHQLTEEELIGPGWAGITNRRDPNWIMNMILNVNVMTELDSMAHSLLQDARVQMPDQGLPVDECRSVLEFMRQNDVDQLGKKDEGAEG